MTAAPHRWRDLPTHEARVWQRCTRCGCKRLVVFGIRGGIVWDYWQTEPWEDGFRWVGSLPPDCLPTDSNGRPK